MHWIFPYTKSDNKFGLPNNLYNLCLNTICKESEENLYTVKHWNLLYNKQTTKLDISALSYRICKQLCAVCWSRISEHVHLKNAVIFVLFAFILLFKLTFSFLIKLKCDLWLSKWCILFYNLNKTAVFFCSKLK